jgi:putative DNA primase/helicase
MSSKINILYDGSFDIAIGKHRRDTSWKNKQMKWSEFVQRVSETHRTAESYTEYAASKKHRQDEIKDIGGFVGGYLNGGRRKNGSVVHRQLVTLDVDYATKELWDDFVLLYDCAAVIYSTHKHSAKTPRYRLIIPLDREVMIDEYMAISRRIAGQLGIELFDHTTFQPTRLMYWPSTSKDGAYEFHYQDDKWLNADEILNTYHDWSDSSEWPVSEREGSVISQAIKKQGDPLDKPGVIGAFCRTYTIHEVIELFLNDVYDSCDVEGRYTYKEGSTSAGLVTYDDKFAYSHHGTDPISGKLCNAFDLIRIHKFGLKDEDTREGTPGNKLPSFVAMEDFARSIPEVRKQAVSDRLNETMSDFGVVDNVTDDEEEDNEEWKKDLDIDRKSKILSTVKNIVIILENDPRLKGRLAFNEFEQREVILKKLPWPQKEKDAGYFTDADVSNLVHYLEKYDISSTPKVEHALKIVFSRHSIHPIKKYLSSLKWDGLKRVDTLLIDYLGADDNEYVRAAIRKMLVAAAGRIYNPGIKFDYMLTIVGKQGIGKSSLIQKLAVNDQWYSESIPTVHGKEAQEAVQGVWIAEMGELAGLKKADVESIKHFISTRYDRYRVSYGKRTENFPRQCVFFGTTNNREFLKDPTGNRRFWPIDTVQGEPSKNVFVDLTPYEVNQVWAEAVVLFKKGEPLYLPKEVEEIAYKVQSEFTEKDERIGAIEKYLDTLVPESWDEMSIWDRRSFLQGDDISAKGTKQRDKVCIAEIWCELFGGQVKDMTTFNTKDLHAIMHNLPGWEKARGTKRFSVYGQQRAYNRTKNGNTEVKVSVPTAKIIGNSGNTAGTQNLN